MLFWGYSLSAKFEIFVSQTSQVKKNPMLITPARTHTPTPLWSINILIYCTHITKIERLLTHFHLCVQVCTCTFAFINTSQQVPSNPLHYIPNNGHSHERNHMSLLNRLYIMHICIFIYQLMFYIYKRLYIHSLWKPCSISIHPPLSTYGETFLIFHLYSITLHYSCVWLSVVVVLKHLGILSEKQQIN